MAGLGSPLGVTPFGTGTPATAQTRPSKSPLGARFLDPTTRDYALDSEGEVKRMPGVRQQVLLAVTTLINSSSTLPGAGISLPRKIGADFARLTRISVEAACAHITESGRATIDDVTAEVVSTGRTLITVTYTDLTTGEVGTLPVTA